MNLGSVEFVLKITFHVSHWIQLKFKGYLVHYQNKLLYLKTVVSSSVELVSGRIANPTLYKNVRKVSLFFIKNVKKTLMSIPLFASFVIKKYLFPEIDLSDLIDLSFNSNYICSCLENNKLENNSKDFMNKIINFDK